jgi:hypothetical protein
MANKPNQGPSGPITDKDLADFVEKDSDFAFEMQVVTQLRGVGFGCSHSGTYQDPVSDKIRQFDVRATKKRGSCTLALAVECKNLRPDCPLLLSAVPRVTDEAFHDIIFREANPHFQIPRVRPVAGNESVYTPGEMVGKKTDQVSRNKDGALVSDDSKTFEKLNQAMNSCTDLVRQLVINADQPFARAVVPVLVVPANLLWQVDYAFDGALVTAPRRVPRATMFLNHSWSVESQYGTIISYRLSHIEFVTIDALATVVDGWLGPSGFFRTVSR